MRSEVVSGLFKILLLRLFYPGSEANLSGKEQFLYPRIPKETLSPKRITKTKKYICVRRPYLSTKTMILYVSKTVHSLLVLQYRANYAVMYFYWSFKFLKQLSM
jgi:hypothetical protein